MEYHRYGRFSFGDYISTWFAILFMLILVVSGFLTHVQVYLLIWPFVFSLMMVWSIYKPNSERFTISHDIITVICGRRKKQIEIPNEATLILAYADICPPLAKHVSIGNQTYLLKGKYAIVILQKLPLETVLEGLHPPFARKYTSSAIEEWLGENSFVYSFVCDQVLLEQLLTHRECQVIIPESLLGYVSFNHSKVNVHIDIGY